MEEIDLSGCPTASRNLNSFLLRNNDVFAWRVIDGEAVVSNLKENTFNVLTPVATRIFELADGQMRVKEIIEAIYREFESERDILEKDCLEFISLAVRKGLMILPSVKKENDNCSDEKEDNRDKGLFETLREKAIEKKIPIVSHLDLTYNCNLKCVHCYTVSENRPTLNTFEIKNILEQLAEAKTLYLTLSGGEIFKREDYFEIAFYARRLNFALRLLTNATLINEKTVNEIVLLHPELVSISIYSTNSKVHDEITRTPGSLHKSLSALKILKGKGIKLKLSTVIMRQNEEEWYSIYNLAQELGAQFQADYRIAPKNNGDKSPLKFHVDDENLYSILSYPIFAKGGGFDPEEVYTGVFNTVPCGAGHMSCYISPYGDVYPCVQFPFNCGNLKEKSFAEIWRNSSQMLYVRSITIPQLTECSFCNFFRHCRICIGLNYVERGDIFSPSKRTCKEANIMKKLGLRRR